MTEFQRLYTGRLWSVLAWDQLTALWQRIDPAAGWFLVAVGVSPADVLVVSDDPLSDLAGAKRMGMRAAFVLSGKYRDESVLTQLPLDERPDCVTPRIGDLLTRQIIAL